METPIVVCTAAGLDALDSTHTPVSAWLHIDGDERTALKRVALKLVALGCRHFAVSGPHAEAIHDELDDLLLEHEELILTTWHTGSMLEGAAEFLTVECPGGGAAVRMAVALGGQERTALTTVAEMVRCLSDQI